MNEDLAILDQIIDLLSDERRWTKNAYAKDISGNPVDPYLPDATCWCLDGAHVRVVGDYSAAGTLALVYPETDQLIPLGEDGYANYVKWQDAPERTHAEVMAFLRNLRAAVAVNDEAS
jgi:hypothetical protein